jgi:hypothetical protein
MLSLIYRHKKVVENNIVKNYKNMMHENYGEKGEHEECGCGCHHMHGPMKKEFKLAKLEKKEKMLKAELEFIDKMKEMIKKMPEDEK